MNYKNNTIKQDDQLESQHIFYADILDSITNNGSVPKVLANLRIKTFNRNLIYQSDFVSSGFAQFLISSLAPDNDYLCEYLEIAKNYTLSQGTKQYTIEMCNLGLVISLNGLIESLHESKVDNLFQKKIIYIITILSSISSTNMDIKNSVVNEVSLEAFIDIATNHSDETDLIKLIYFLFGSLLNSKGDEELDVQYLSKFEKYFPYFVELYIKKRESLLDRINILKIFIILTKIPSFSILTNYFDSENYEHSIIDEIMEMINENDDETLELVLSFDNKIMMIDFMKGNSYVSRYLELFKKYSNDITSYAQVPEVYQHKIGILYYDAMMIQFIMEHASTWIPEDEYYSIALDLINNAKNSPVKFRVFFLNCLFTLTKKCNTDCLFNIINNSYALFLTDFLDIDDNDDLISSIIDEINFLTDKEMEINETQNVLYEFLDNGGLQFFQDYQSDGTNQDIANQISATVQKYVITL